MKSDTKIFFGAIIVSLIVIVSGIFLFGQDNSPKRENLGVAAMKIDKTSADLGKMKGDEERKTEFIITNTSSSTLRIWNVATSCDCTFATISIAGKTSAEFNMAGMMSSDLTNWIGEVPAGQDAKLTVIYRPKIMPVTGAVSRQVTFATNDPKNEKVEVSIKANVL